MDFYSLIHDPGVQTAGAILISVFVLFNVTEFIYSQVKNTQYFLLPDLLVNITIAFLQQLADVFNKLVFIIGYVYVLENWSVRQLADFPDIPLGFPITFESAFPYIQLHPLHIAIWLLIILVADFCQYWLHRLSHEVNILWAGHIVHHSMEAYNFAVALRQSFIESLYTWVFYLPLAFLGVPWQLFIMAYTISLIWQFLVHTRYINKLGWLEYVFSTPSHHRVHHGKNDIYIDKNYGAFLIIWDKWFGTFQPETETVQYGIKSSIDTHNPLWVNTHHHIHIGKLFLASGSWRDKLKVIFSKPGFQPAGAVQIPAAEYGKPAEISTFKKIYVIFNFLAIAFFSVQVILYFDSTHEWKTFFAAAVLIVSSHVINIALLENKWWADLAEVTRLVLLCVVGLILNYAYDWHNGFLLAGAAIFLLGFSYWVAQDFKHRQLNTLNAH